MVEMGNEMYDHTVPEIKTLFPTAAAYASFVESWVDAIRARFPNVEIAVCGSSDPEWLAQVLNSTVGRDTRNAVTVHVYSGLPEGPYATDTDKRAVLDRAVWAAQSTRDTLDAVGLAHARRVWFTEIGVYGATHAERTWLKALTMTRKVSKQRSACDSTCGVGFLARATFDAMTDMPNTMHTPNARTHAHTLAPCHTHALAHTCPPQLRWLPRRVLFARGKKGRSLCAAALDKSCPAVLPRMWRSKRGELYNTTGTNTAVCQRQPLEIRLDRLRAQRIVSR